MTVSFLLSKEDAQKLQDAASGAHGAVSALVRTAVMSVERMEPWEFARAMPHGPYTEKFNVVEGMWSDRAAGIATKLTEKGVTATQGAVIRVLIHRFLEDTEEAQPA
jgi:hypothetical protein